MTNNGRVIMVPDDLAVDLATKAIRSFAQRYPGDVQAWIAAGLTPRECAERTLLAKPKGATPQETAVIDQIGRLLAEGRLDQALAGILGLM